MSILPEWVQAISPQMASGLLVTLQLALITVVASVLIGLLLGTASSSPSRMLTGFVGIYIEVWRGLPIVVTLFLMYFALPIFNITLVPLWAASVGLTLWGSANLAVIVGGAIDSISVTQFSSSRALGMSRLQQMRLVILPQAFRRMIPPAIGTIMILIQSTTAAALIDVQDVLFVGRANIERLTLTTGDTQALPILGSILVFFYLVSYALNRLANHFEKRLNV